MSADEMLMGEWRDSSERSRLVEERIALEKRNRLLERELRDRVRAEEMFLAGHPTEAALMERVRELEETIQRQNDLLRRAS